MSYFQTSFFVGWFEFEYMFNEPRAGGLKTRCQTLWYVAGSLSCQDHAAQDCRALRRLLLCCRVGNFALKPSPVIVGLILYLHTFFIATTTDISEALLPNLPTSGSDCPGSIVHHFSLHP